MFQKLTALFRKSASVERGLKFGIPGAVGPESNLDEPPVATEGQAMTTNFNPEPHATGELNETVTQAAPSSSPVIAGPQGAPIHENEKPEPSSPIFQEKNSGPGHDWVRFAISVGLLVILIAGAFVGMYGWLNEKKSGEELQSLGTFLAPFLTLSASVITFYFASNRKK